MRLIDADALKESLKKLKAEGTNRKYVQGLQDAIDGYFPQIIDDEPTIDAEPVRHGRWIAQGDDMWLCSNCKENIIFSMHESDRTEKHRYCCKCGARMDGDDND